VSFWNRLDTCLLTEMMFALLRSKCVNVTKDKKIRAEIGHELENRTRGTSNISFNLHLANRKN